MPSVRERTVSLNGLLKRVPSRLIVAAALAAAFLSASRAADNPARALQAEFEAAKASLAAEDLASAENHYVDAITLGLRQLAQLSLSLEEINQAATYLDSALRLKPGDVETQMDAAGIWFRKGDVGKAKALIKAVVSKEPTRAPARGLLGRIYVFVGDSYNAIQELKASVDLEEDFETSYFLGIAYLKATRLAQSSAWFHRLETTMGESAPLHMLFGRAYLITKFPHQPLPQFPQPFSLFPNYPPPHRFL